MASMHWAKAPYKKLKHSEYLSHTGTNLNQFQKLKDKITQYLDKDTKSGKSYIHFDPQILKIPIKNTFELKVNHYVMTKKHDSKNPKYDFEEFAEKYEIPQSRQNKYKFKKLISSICL